jgi:DNA (cytosine-5)-methyltransferase 1
MVFIEQNVRRFKPGFEPLYRRMTVRECARLQTFPDSFIFHYSHIEDGYKMVGNAVPVRMAKIMAVAIKEQLESSAQNRAKHQDERLALPQNHANVYKIRAL